VVVAVGWAGAAQESDAVAITTPVARRTTRMAGAAAGGRRRGTVGVLLSARTEPEREADVTS